VDNKDKYFLWKQTDSTLDMMIRPFLVPLQSLGEATYEKLVIAVASSVLVVIGTVTELIETPETLWVGLLMLTVLDFIAGTARALFDKKLKFDWHRFGRTSYKLVVYPVVIVATATLGNMYPTIFGWVQYVSLAIIAGQEGFSILRHIKGVSFAKAVFQVITERRTEGFKKIQDKIDDELYRKHLSEKLINENHMADKKKDSDNKA
jgi:phage-related holin